MFGRGAGNEVVVAIDFGTTRTAYATTQQGFAEDNIEVGVPAGSSSASTVYDSKTPSNVLLDASGDKVLAYGYDAQEKYASKKRQDCLFFRHFKMGLAKATTQDPMVKALNGRSLKLSVVITKALEYVKDSVLKHLNGKGLSVRATSIIWVITVPAIWNDWAKQMMRSAAHRAGMIRELRSPCLKIALEPECACISVQMEKLQGVLSDVGHKLMIVDCGGGTVDITAHQVERTDPLSLKELMPPDGGPYGATCVDAKFYEFLAAFLGRSNYDRLQQRREFLAVTRSWEDKKVSFTGEENEDEDWFAPLNIGDALLCLGLGQDMEEMVARWNGKNRHRQVEALTASTLGLSYNLIMSFYEEPISNIVNKINTIRSSPQNRSALRGLGWVVIAGGFGRSPVLQQKIRDNFQGSDVRVVVCRHPDLAIVKGAAAFGARPNVFESRKAKYTFGTDETPVFDPNNHDHMRHEDEKYLASDGTWRLRTFCIHGRVGDDISVGTASTRRIYLPVTKEQEILTFDILMTTSRTAFMANERGVRKMGSWRVVVDKSVPLSERRYSVEFLFGETENICKCHKVTKHGDIPVHEVEVQFPSDAHWNMPTMN